MGIERDYLMRQLMLLFEVIQKIINFRKKGQYKDAEEQINYFYSLVNLEKDFHSTTIESLMEYLIHEKKMTNNHIEMIAYVLKEQGELEQNAEKKVDFFRKAWFLLEKADRESTSFSMDRQLNLAQLRDYIN